jgi:hypothetical protein
VDWVEKLQVPGLILAGAVIYGLFRLLERRDELLNRLAVEVSGELSSHGKTLERVAAILDLLCRKAKAGRPD